MASMQQRPRRRTWSVDAGDPATVLAEARKALFVMVGFLAVIWIVQVANWVDHYQLTQSYGIRPRDVGSLPDILTAPFLHVSWAHIEGNSGPLFIFGFLAAYRGVTKFFGVTALVVLTSGLG
ncbi:MAG TPA: rhomboid family intramembrane serine protease, partial [Streptosporangiaceae bacterium]|nr:rhomboid family intramembrane serine protease [Streptosporangiaceae bacterium]